MHSQKQPVTEEAVTVPAPLQNLTILQRMGKPLAGWPGPLGGILFAAPLVPTPTPLGPLPAVCPVFPVDPRPSPYFRLESSMTRPRTVSVASSILAASQGLRPS